MPLVQVTLIEGRPPERVRELIAAVTEAVVRTLDAPAASVRVIVGEVPASHWGVGGVPKDTAPPQDADPSPKGRE
jgi:4-oxalocrotonate tautomerase